MELTGLRETVAEAGGAGNAAGGKLSKSFSQVDQVGLLYRTPGAGCERGGDSALVLGRAKAAAITIHLTFMRTTRAGLRRNNGGVGRAVLLASGTLELGANKAPVRVQPVSEAVGVF